MTAHSRPQAPQRTISPAVMRYLSFSAVLQALAAASPAWYRDRGGPEHCAWCYGRAVAAGVVFG